MTEDRPEASEEAPKLIFPWSHKERRAGWLTLGLFIAALSLVGVSMVFRVIRNEPRDAPHTARPILLLDPTSPLTRALVNRAAEQSFLHLGAYNTDSAEPILAEHTPVFSPSYKGFDFTLKTIPNKRTASNLPGWFMPHEPPLPPRAELENMAPPPAPVVTPEFALRPIFAGAIAQRQIERNIEVRPPISHDAANLAFRAAVDSTGRVALALPIKSNSSIVEDEEKLRLAINRLRFSPTAAGPLDWGIITFSWQEPSSK